ncbi:pinopsin-like [Genypterus blacodes]|uniref:pinopsin-like n=1 Tax=Genypterus blacodes TaxID=154954 RepID=UPI003F770EED
MIVSNVSLGCAQCRGGPNPAGALSPAGHLVAALCLGFIGTVGFLSNFLVLTLFCRYRTLRTPMNLLLVSISTSDLLVSVLGTPFSFAASTQGRWLIGRAGCVWYGFINASLGIVSLISLAVLSYERYSTMMAPTIADGTNFRPALRGICFSWLYSLAWTAPPLLGWSRYGPEGPGTTCSVDWKTRTGNNISYVVCLFTFCLVLPLSVILYSYGKLLQAVRQVSAARSAVARRREQRVLLMIVTMVMSYLVCWLPYGVVALLSVFGPPDLLTPEASVTPSLLAKSSTVINPFIYIFMNKQFFMCFRAFLTCSAPPPPGSAFRTLSRVTLRTFHPGLKHNASVPSPPMAPPTQGFKEGSSEGATDPAPSAPPAAFRAKAKVILMVEYKE